MSETDGIMYPEVDALGRMATAAGHPIGFVEDDISPDICEPTTWYTGAMPLMTSDPNPCVTLEHVSGYTLYKIPDNAGGDQKLLDLKHGLLTNEDAVNMALSAGFYAATTDPNCSAHPVIRVNGTVQTEDDYFTSTENDYSIDYTTGRVTFHTALEDTDTVTMYAGKAASWGIVIEPTGTEKIEIISAEIQMTLNFNPKDTVHSVVEVWDEDEEEWVLEKLPNGLPKDEANKTVQDIINRSYGNYAQIPRIGSNGRGTKAPEIQFPLTLPEHQLYVVGQRFRVYLENNTPGESSDSDEALCVVTVKYSRK